MRLTKLIAACAAASMVAMPVAATAATANPAAKLSLSKAAPEGARASSKAGKSKAFGTGGFLLLFVGLAVAAGVIAGTTGDSTPDSP